MHACRCGAHLCHHPRAAAWRAPHSPLSLLASSERSACPAPHRDLQVGRAGRFGTKGLAITFVSSQADSEVLNAVQERFDVDIKPLPDKIDASTYMNTN